MDKKLEGTVVLVVGCEQKSRLEWYQEIQKLGGETSIIFSPKRTTHVVTTSAFLSQPYTAGHVDCIKAQEQGCTIVNEDWLQQCAMMGMRVPEEQFAIKVKKPDTMPKFPKIKSTPVQPYESGSKFPAEHEIFDEIVLQVTDFQHNFNKYYSLEFHYGKLGNGKEVFRIFSHYGRTDDLESNPKSGKKECRHFPNFSEATIGLRGVYEEKTSEKKGYKPILLVHSNIGSDVRIAKGKAKISKKKEADPFSAAGGHGQKEKEEEEEEETQSAVDFEPKSDSRLHPTIQIFVNYIFTEAAAALSSSIAAKITSRGIETPLGILNKEQVESGDKVLMEIYETLSEDGEDKANKEGKTRQKLRELSGKFYTIIPHRIGRSKVEVEKSVIDTFGSFEAKQELLQLMIDLLDVTASQGDGSKNLSVIEMKYRALKNEMCVLSPTSQAFQEIKSYIDSTQTNTDRYKDKTIEVTNVFGLKKPKEVESFEKESDRIHPQKLLFHGSRVSNWVGLLSRGILMPKVIVRAGGKRTDAGLLGNGIYFASSSSAASQYATAGVLGTRYLMCCRVATGRSKEYTEHQIGLSAPPANHDSVQSLAKSGSTISAFHDEEFVIFNTAQQRQEYLVEFKLHDKPLPSNLNPSSARIPNSVNEYKMGDPTCLLAQHPDFSSSSSASSSSSFSTAAHAMPKPSIAVSSDRFMVADVDVRSKGSSSAGPAKSPAPSSSPVSFSKAAENIGISSDRFLVTGAHSGTPSKSSTPSSSSIISPSKAASPFPSSEASIQVSHDRFMVASVEHPGSSSATPTTISSTISPSRAASAGIPTSEPSIAVSNDRFSVASVDSPPMAASSSVSYASHIETSGSFAWEETDHWSPSDSLRQSIEEDKSPSERLTDSIYSSMDEPLESAFSYDAPLTSGLESGLVMSGESSAPALVVTSSQEKSSGSSNSSSSSCLPGSLKEEKEAEDKFRQLFVNSPASFSVQNPFVHLVDIFSEHASFTAQRKSEEEKQIPVLLSHFAVDLQQGQTTATSEGQFRDKWAEVSSGVLDNIDWKGVFAAGGAILKCVDARGLSLKTWGDSDIDLFFYGLTDFQAEEKIRSIYDEICSSIKGKFGYEPEIVRTKHALTILGVPPVPHIQIILRMYHSPAEVLMGFDVDSCTFGFDGKKAWTLPRGRRALTKGFNLVDLSRRSLTYEHRLLKYSKRGFAVLVPGYEKGRVSQGLFHPSRTVGEVAGLGRLVLLDHREVNGVPRSFAKKKQTSGDESQEDYMSVFLPWGKTIQYIMALLKKRDQGYFFGRKKAGVSNPGPLVVAGISSVLSGNSSWLDSCSFGKISWLRENPGQQGGVGGGLLTGSFHPVTAETWEQDAYKQYHDVPATASHLPAFSQPSYPAGSFSAPKKKAATSKTATPKKAVHFDFSKPANEQGFQKGSTSAFEVSPGAWGGRQTQQPASTTTTSSSAWTTTTTSPTSPSINTSGNAFQVSASPWSTPTSNKKPADSSPSTPTTSARVLDFPAPGSSSPFSATPIFSSPLPSSGGLSSGLSSGLTATTKPAPTPASSKPASSGFSFGPATTTTPKPTPTPTPSPTPAFSFAPSSSTSAPTPAAPKVSGFSFGPSTTPAPASKTPSSAFSFAPVSTPPSSSTSSSNFAHIEHVFDQTAPKTPSAKLLLLISLLSKGGLLTAHEKDVLKDMVIAENENLLCALEVFEIQKDFEEMADTLKEVAALGK